MTTAFTPGTRVIARSRDAGVFAGTLARRDGAEVELTDARRIWYWDGAASLSELATRGTSRPANCQFPAAVPSVLLTEVCEVLVLSAEADATIAGVPVWSR